MTKQSLAKPAETKMRSKSVGTLVPMALRIQKVEANDLSELRRMTCPEGQIYENCPNLKALAASCRHQHPFSRSALEIGSAAHLRRYSDDSADGRQGRAYWLKLAKSHLIGGYQTLRARFSPTYRPEANYTVDMNGRQLIVEFISGSHEHNNNHSKRKCKSSEDVSSVISRTSDSLLGDYKEHKNHNMSSCLIIHSLKEGRLTAEITLEDCPDDGDLIVRIRNYTLEILTRHKVRKGSGGSGSSSSSAKGNKDTEREVVKCGQVDIPIYVDPGTLSFDLLDNRTLIMEGDTKTSLPRTKYCSNEELACSSTRSTPPRSKSPFERRQSNSTATWYMNNNNESARPAFYRQRSYTQ